MLKKREVYTVIIGAIMFIAGLIADAFDSPASLSFYLVALFSAGGSVFMQALRNIFMMRIIDESLLMSIATIGAFIIGQYPEGAAVMLFYRIGDLFEQYAVGRSRKSIAELMDIRPDSANLLRDGEIVSVDPYDVVVGDTIVVKAGERIPLDAKLLKGSGLVDTSALTGESVPREVVPGDDLLSGCINVNGLLEAEVTREFGESTVSKILDLVENASGKKSKSENFITKFARYYTPAVVAAAALLAFIPPMLVPGAELRDWGYRALTFLVVSCPCALVISVPLSFFGGIGGASRVGILIKGGNYIETLAQAGMVVFDKTGTLTQGVFSVRQICPSADIEPRRLLEMAALAESYSNHPISQSLREAYGREPDKSRITEVTELPGMGVLALIDGETAVLAGNAALMQREGIAVSEESALHDGTIVHIAENNIYAGHIIISDEQKPDSARAVEELRKSGIDRIVMLTGDVKSAGKAVADELGITEVYSELLPEDKVSKVEELIGRNGKLIFVGDGVNDAPVLARADVGVAMGGLGSDAAIEAADVVIMTDEPSKVAVAIRLARRAMRIVRQNIIFALGVKAIVLLLGALGIASMWMAVFADVGVSVIAILNALRALGYANTGA